MKILLIDPPDSFLQGQGQARYLLPLGLSSVGAVLKQAGHEVRLLIPDLRSYSGDDPWSVIRETILAEAPDLVGLTGMSPCEASMLGVVREVRQALGADVPLIVGGQHATCWTDRVAAWPGVDAVVDGEGEDPALALCQGFALQGKAFDVSQVAGVVAIRDGELVRGPPRRPAPDLDKLPTPLREGLVWGEDLPKSFYGILNTMRGCPFDCIYCSLSLACDRSVRFRSPELVVDELEEIVHRYQANNVIFHDTAFTLRPQRTLRIMELMRERKLRIPFVAQTRADLVQKEVIESMADRGCARIFLGIESGDEDTLARMSKGMSLATVRQAVKDISSSGVDAAGFFMIGFPWEDEALMRKTVSFALDLGLAYISLHSANPVPGSRLWQMVPEEKRVVAMDFVAPRLNLTALPDEKYRSLFEELRGLCLDYNRRGFLL